jgi:hypothetical protein
MVAHDRFFSPASDQVSVQTAGTSWRAIGAEHCGLVVLDSFVAMVREDGCSTRRKGRKVKGRSQAIAIALKEAGASKYESRKANKPKSREVGAQGRIRKPRLSLRRLVYELINRRGAVHATGRWNTAASSVAVEDD